MSQIENKSKVFVEKLGSLVANKRSIERVEVDLSRVVAIGKPIGNDNSVNMYFENSIWRISKRSYDEIISLWRDLWNVVNVSSGRKSKMYGNHCSCLGTKPFEVDRNYKQYKARKKKKMEKYDKSMRKVRYDNNWAMRF